MAAWLHGADMSNRDARAGLPIVMDDKWTCVLSIEVAESLQSIV
jgi:hypothetical protein